MYQRGSTHVISSHSVVKDVYAPLYKEGKIPTEIADRINMSIPRLMLAEIGKRQVAVMKENDK
jgi:hypothetical protein